MPLSEKNQTLHCRLVEALSAEFAALPTGAPIPSTPELKARFQVAYMTITRALDELVVRGEIVRFRGRGSFTASPVVTTVYYLLPCPPEVQYRASAFFDGALAQARQSGIALRTLPMTADNVFGHVDWASMEKIPDHAAVVVSSPVDFHYVFDFLRRKQCRLAVRNNQPENSDYFEARMSDAHWVCTQRCEAVMRAVELLVQAGRRRLLLLHEGPTWNNPIRKTFRDALTANGLEFNPELELYTTNDYGFCYGRMLSLTFRERGFDGVVATYAAQAMATVNRCKVQHWQIPGEVSLVCLDEHPMLETGPIGVSTVSTNDFEAGRAAVRILAERHVEPVREKIDWVEINRGSI